MTVSVRARADGKAAVRYARGFTLLEFVVAMTLVALIMALMSGGLYLGARTWEGVDGKAARVAEARLASGFLRRQLTALRDVPYAREGDGQTVPLFWGNAGMLEWVAPLPDYVGHGGLSLMRVSLHGDGDARQLVLERWFFHPELLAGRQAGPAWERLTPTAAAQDGQGDVDTATYGRHVLIDRVGAWRIDYFGAPDGDDEAAWLDAWSDPRRYPRLVRIRLAPEGEAWPELVVALPQPEFETPRSRRRARR